MAKYHCEHFDLKGLGPNNIDRLQIEMIPPGSKLLEIGCATGYMSEYLTQKMGCQVTGIELDPDQANLAHGKCHNVIVGAVDSREVQRQIDALVARDGGFKVIFMSQVIEHLAEPEEVLMKSHDWLASDGCLVISTCNIAHWRARLRLLGGTWQYEEYGLFDRSHLRFFTVHSFEKMLDRCGFAVHESAHTFEDFCPVKLLIGKRLLAPSDILRCLPFVGKTLRKKYLHLLRNLVGTQFVYKARKRNGSHQNATNDAPEPATRQNNAE